MKSIRAAVNDKNRLGQYYSFFEQCRKRLLTAGIGSIASFEEHFGFMWGHGLPVENRTDSQNQLSLVWKECRDEILDKINREIRSLKSELELKNGK